MTKGLNIMKNAYPVVLTPVDGGYVAWFPDFESGTQGDSLADVIDMSADAIGLLGVTMEDDGEPIPAPTPLADVRKERETDIVTLVSVDFTACRRRNDARSVRRNVSLPAWLDAAARSAGVNVSAILAAALKKELSIEN